jgi:ATP-dependent protease ClpP protease subunit
MSPEEAKDYGLIDEVIHSRVVLAKSAAAVAAVQTA